MTERDLGVGMRLLLGVLGATALVAGVAVGTMQMRAAYLDSDRVPRLAAAVVCAVIAIGGATLLRGAVRGRITVRRQGRRSWYGGAR